MWAEACDENHMGQREGVLSSLKKKFASREVGWAYTWEVFCDP